MHGQMRNKLNTLNLELDSIFHYNESDRNNDIFELFYTTNATIAPIIYRTILSTCSPNNIGDIRLDYLNDKCLIFNHTNCFDVEMFDQEYVAPFFSEQVLPALIKEIEYDEENIYGIHEGQLDILQKKWYEEYSEKLHKNIFLIDYFILPELLLKIQDLPNLFRKIKSVGLVILDSPNLLINQKINFEYEDEVINDENVNRKTTVNFGKNKRKSLSTCEKSIFEHIIKVIHNLQNEFNFNLIITHYDFERIETLNYLKFKMNWDGFYYDNINKNFRIGLFGDSKVEFIFTLKQFEDKHKIFSIEPTVSYINYNGNAFAYLTYEGGGTYRFRAFYKQGGGYDVIRLIEEREIQVNKN